MVVGSLGMNFVKSSPLDAAILVNDKKIPYRRYQTLFQQIIENRRERSEEPVSEQEIRYLKDQVVQSLVQGEVFSMEAEKLGLRISDFELAQLIQSYPAFQKDGRFDPTLYRNLLNRIRVSVPDFEEEQKRQILAQKVQFLMGSSVKISSLELPGEMQKLLAAASPEERKKFQENPDSALEQVRRKEIQSVLQEWYTALSTTLKVKVLLNKIEGTDAPAPPAKAG